MLVPRTGPGNPVKSLETPALPHQGPRADGTIIDEIRLHSLVKAIEGVHEQATQTLQIVTRLQTVLSGGVRIQGPRTRENTAYVESVLSGLAQAATRLGDRYERGTEYAESITALAVQASAALFPKPAATSTAPISAPQEVSSPSIPALADPQEVPQAIPTGEAPSDPTLADQQLAARLAATGGQPS